MQQEIDEKDVLVQTLKAELKTWYGSSKAVGIVLVVEALLRESRACQLPRVLLLLPLCLSLLLCSEWFASSKMRWSKCSIFANCMER